MRVAVFISSSFTRSGVSSGLASNIHATTLATIGAATLVPST
jgi:hypothetical protein